MLVDYRAGVDRHDEQRIHTLPISLQLHGRRYGRSGPTDRFFGHYAPWHPYAVVTRQPEHPIMAGLPKLWMHANDELYERLRGPAEELEVLATAWSDPAFAGTSRFCLW